jgi:hypothetical protein
MHMLGMQSIPTSKRWILGYAEHTQLFLYKHFVALHNIANKCIATIFSFDVPQVDLRGVKKIFRSLRSRIFTQIFRRLWGGDQGLFLRACRHVSAWRNEKRARSFGRPCLMKSRIGPISSSESALKATYGNVGAKNEAKKC